VPAAGRPRHPDDRSVDIPVACGPRVDYLSAMSIGNDAQTPALDGHSCGSRAAGNRRGVAQTEGG
jgi:hypothetical protein